MSGQSAESGPRRRGPKPLPPGQGKRYPLSMRTTKEIKDKIETASKTSGRSMMAEAEYRLEQSFLTEELIGNPSAYRLMLFLGSIVNGIERKTGKSIFSDFSTFTACGAAISHALRFLGESSFGRDEMRAAYAGASLLDGGAPDELSPMARAQAAALEVLRQKFEQAKEIAESNKAGEANG
jgi:hypothetical protein